MNDLIITIDATPTASGKYIWIVEEQITPAECCYPDWRLVAKGFEASEFAAYKAAMFEVNKLKEVKSNEAN